MSIKQSRQRNSRSKKNSREHSNNDARNLALVSLKGTFNKVLTATSTRDCSRIRREGVKVSKEVPTCDRPDRITGSRHGLTRALLASARLFKGQWTVPSLGSYLAM